MRVQFNNICPEDEIFVKAFLNELDLRKKEELITHILACPRCRLKFQTMKQVKNELKKTGELREEKFSRLKISLKYAGVAAGILLVLSASLFILSKFKKDGILRGSNKEKLLLIEPVGKISTPPSLF
jgi:hypothetical protein